MSLFHDEDIDDDGEGPEEDVVEDVEDVVVEEDDEDVADDDFQDEPKDEYPDDEDNDENVYEEDEVIEEPKEDTTFIVLLNRVRQRKLKAQTIDYDFIGSPLEKE